MRRQSSFASRIPFLRKKISPFLFFALSDLPFLIFIECNSSWTNRLLTSTDKGAIQLNIGNVDPNTGLFTGESTPLAISGYIRSKGESDMAINALFAKMK